MPITVGTSRAAAGGQQAQPDVEIGVAHGVPRWLTERRNVAADCARRESRRYPSRQKQ